MAQNSVKTSTAIKVTGKAVSVLATNVYGGSKLIAPPILASTPDGDKWSASSPGRFTQSNH